jgi:hypothetical protein
MVSAMTRANVYAFLLAAPTANDRTPERLTAAFGQDWAEPMRSLIDLGIVIADRYQRSNPLVFYVTAWRGMSDKPIHADKTVSRKEAKD